MRGSIGRPWFAQKRYGYGASLPITWQGWLTMGLFFAALIGEIVFATGWQRSVAIGLIVAIFVVICWFKTDGGWRWRWGDKD